MSNTQSIALITISSLSLVMSTATLVIIVVGGRKVQKKVEHDVAEVKKTANTSIQNIKNALDSIEI